MAALTLDLADDLTLTDIGDVFTLSDSETATFIVILTDTFTLSDAEGDTSEEFYPLLSLYEPETYGLHQL